MSAAKRVIMDILRGIPLGFRALGRLAEDFAEEYPLPVLLLGGWWIFQLWLAYGTR